MRVAAVAGFFTLLATGLAAGAGYFETSFEAAEGYPAGALVNPELPWGVVTGAAEIVESDAIDGEQSLRLVPGDPIGRVRVQSRTLAESAQLFVDFWVRTVATDGEVEFLDFDGALVAFRRVGEEGEVSVFHATSELAGHWIGTGLRFVIGAEGAAGDWIRVTILRDYATGSWQLWLNGVVAFQNVRALPPDRDGVRSVWVLGDEVGPVLVDRFYFGAVNPFVLRPNAGGVVDFGSVSRDGSDRPQLIGPRTEPSREMQSRSEDTDIPLTEPVLRGFTVEGKQGGEVNVAKSTVNFLDGSGDPNISAFSPRYDEDGNALPMELTVTADVELRAGADLRRVFWEIRRLPKSFDPMIDGDLLMSGNFDGTLARVVEVAGEDVRKGLSVNVRAE